MASTWENLAKGKKVEKNYSEEPKKKELDYTPVNQDKNVFGVKKKSGGSSSSQTSTPAPKEELNYTPVEPVKKSFAEVYKAKPFENYTPNIKTSNINTAYESEVKGTAIPIKDGQTITTTQIGRGSDRGEIVTYTQQRNYLKTEEQTQIPPSPFLPTEKPKARKEKLYSEEPLNNYIQIAQRERNRKFAESEEATKLRNAKPRTFIEQLTSPLGNVLGTPTTETQKPRNFVIGTGRAIVNTAIIGTKFIFNANRPEGQRSIWGDSELSPVTNKETIKLGGQMVIGGVGVSAVPVIGSTVGGVSIFGGAGLLLGEFGKVVTYETASAEEKAFIKNNPQIVGQGFSNENANLNWKENLIGSIPLVGTIKRESGINTGVEQKQQQNFIEGASQNFVNQKDILLASKIAPEYRASVGFGLDLGTVGVSGAIEGTAGRSALSKTIKSVVVKEGTKQSFTLLAKEFVSTEAGQSVKKTIVKEGIKSALKVAPKGALEGVENTFRESTLKDQKITPLGYVFAGGTSALSSGLAGGLLGSTKTGSVIAPTGTQKGLYKVGYYTTYGVASAGSWEEPVGDVGASLVTKAVSKSTRTPTITPVTIFTETTSGGKKTGKYTTTEAFSVTSPTSTTTSTTTEAKKKGSIFTGIFTQSKTPTVTLTKSQNLQWTPTENLPVLFPTTTVTKSKGQTIGSTITSSTTTNTTQPTETPTETTTSTITNTTSATTNTFQNFYMPFNPFGFGGGKGGSGGRVRKQYFNELSFALDFGGLNLGKASKYKFKKGKR